MVQVESKFGNKFMPWQGGRVSLGVPKVKLKVHKWQSVHVNVWRHLISVHCLLTWNKSWVLDMGNKLHYGEGEVWG